MNKNMREIKFRGKRLDNGEWAYGLLTMMWGQYHIINRIDENTAYSINPSTVGQYTGFELYNDPYLLRGEDGKRQMFEGDIVRFSEFDYSGIDHERVGVVYWCGSGFYIDCTENYGDEAIYDLAWAYEQDECMEIVGNVHDNPELVGEG